MTGPVNYCLLLCLLLAALVSFRVKKKRMLVDDIRYCRFFNPLPQFGAAQSLSSIVPVP